MKESNVRYLTKTLAVLSLLAPASAHPLGIGDIKLHSALNQNLNAEIALVLAGEKLSDIKVNLAPPDKYDEAGVPWNYFLSKIKFETVGRPDGTAIIKISTREALKEPFLGLLLEVNWPRGNLYREFSVIVDPPDVYEQATTPVVALPERSSYEPELTSPDETLTRPVPNETRHGFQARESYGPTTKRDTLWKVAERASSQSDVSVEQMMIAIYQENPYAFYKENINALRLGKTLKIPKREVALKISRKQALAEFDRQTAAWKSRLTPPPVETASAEGKENVAGEVQQIGTQLTLAAPSGASITENAEVMPGQDQATSGTQATQGINNASTGGGTQTDAASGKSQGIDALQSQLVEMQKQLVKMQELIALKDQQLAALKDIAEVKSEIQSLAQTSTPSLTQPAGQTPSEPVPQTPPPAAPPADQQHPVEPVPAEPVKPIATDSLQQPVSQHDSEAEADSYYLNIGAIGFGVFSILGWLWWRKRQVDAKTDSESMFAHTIRNEPVTGSAQVRPVAPAATTQIIDASIGYNVDPVGGSSFLSEFTPSDFDAFDTDQGEIDPMSEADVYLAYGRYQQAEDLIRQAIVEQPDRDECKLKLLEIYYANENKKAFEAYANELLTAGKKSDTGFWKKVTEMGNEICPDSTLFSPGVHQASAEDNGEEKSKPVSLAKNANTRPADFDISDALLFDEASFDEFLNDDLEPQSPETDSGGSYADLSSMELEDDKLDDEQRNNQALEFDLSSLSSFTTDADSVSFDDESPEKKQTSDELDTGYDVESFDFELNSGNSGKALLDDGDLTATTDKESHAGSFFLDEDFDFDFSDEEEKNTERQDEFGVSDLTDMDEFETKLDLARAYLDMGDEASAKEIIEGVLEKGSAEQKKVAQKIIDDID